MRFGKGLALFLAGVAPAFPQVQVSETTFEVASIKPSLQGQGRPVDIRGGPGSDDPSYITFEHIRLPALITYAYGLKIHQVNGIDQRLLQETFDVRVRLPEGTTEDQIPAMMRVLLAERFHLRVHTQTKDADIYELVQHRKGHKLKPPTAPAETKPLGESKDTGSVPKIPPGLSMQVCGATSCRLQQVNKSLDRLIAQLSAEVNAPVKNATRLTGTFDFVLSWGLPVPVSEIPLDAPPPLRTALTEQLGLRLQQRRGKEEVLIVDSVDPQPSEN